VNGTLFRVWNLDGWSPGSNADLEVSAMAMDRDGATAVLGYRGGNVRVRRLGETPLPAARADSVDFIGHRGSVTSLAVDAGHELIASGGADGVVRLWDLGVVAPGGVFGAGLERSEP
jgi:WD40 repeat protein